MANDDHPSLKETTGDLIGDLVVAGVAGFGPIASMLAVLVERQLP